MSINNPDWEEFKKWCINFSVSVDLLETDEGFEYLEVDVADGKHVVIYEDGQVYLQKDLKRDYLGQQLFGFGIIKASLLGLITGIV